MMPQNEKHPVFDDMTVPLKDIMVEYIREHFSNLLGKDVNLLDTANGLDIIAMKLQDKMDTGREKTKVA